MLNVNYFNDNFSGVNIIYCNENEKTDFINYICNKYPDYNYISYMSGSFHTKNEIMAKNKRKVKYIKSIIFSDISKYTTFMKGMTPLNVDKFKTPVFFFSNSIEIHKKTYSRIFISPLSVVKYNYKINLNYKQKKYYTDNFKSWMVITNNTTNPMIKYTKLSLTKHHLSVKIKNLSTIMDKISDEDELDYFFDNPVEISPLPISSIPINLD
jgi:hypothetical protein